MKIVHTEYLIKAGTFPSSRDWKTIERDVRQAIKAVVWPKGSRLFTIYPQRKGNGVKPIKDAFCLRLKQKGWELETRLPFATRKKPGPMDATKQLSKDQFFAAEWETGNISSSHRALNKMALGIKGGILKGGVLILPTRRLYSYLTDRAGNFEEIEPYFDLWRSVTCADGILAVIVVEHDATSYKVPRIKKGTDGRGLI
ncbi:MAG: restriction endonuclease [Nitrospirae bacterium]|nr:restriction endonuclease [Nitrospirota bacterium]